MNEEIDVVQQAVMAANAGIRFAEIQSRNGRCARRASCRPAAHTSRGQAPRRLALRPPWHR